jgi:hypothetical protein
LHRLAHRGGFTAALGVKARHTATGCASASSGNRRRSVRLPALRANAADLSEPAAARFAPLRRRLASEHDYPIFVFGIPSYGTEGFFRFCHASRACGGRL